MRGYLSRVSAKSRAAQYSHILQVLLSNFVFRYTEDNISKFNTITIANSIDNSNAFMRYFRMSCIKRSSALELMVLILWYWYSGSVDESSQENLSVYLHDGDRLCGRCFPLDCMQPGENLEIISQWPLSWL